MNAPEKPMFVSIGKCMEWALELHIIARSNVKVATYTKFAKTDERDREPDEEKPPVSWYDLERKPTGQDGWIQAGWIVGRLLSLSPRHIVYLCSKNLRHERRQEAQAMLLEYVLPCLSTGVHERHLLRELLAKKFGKPHVKIKELAERFDVSRKKVSETYKQVGETLDAIGLRAENEAMPKLKGLVFDGEHR